jgi:hypothetical protein
MICSKTINYIIIITLLIILKLVDSVKMDTVCKWDNDYAVKLVHNKKAIVACLFLSFIGYTAAVILSEVKRGTKVSLELVTLNKNH